MKYFSMFSGIGGFELGIKQANDELYNLRPNELADSERPEKLHNTKDKLQQWECVGYSEVDKYAIQIYEKHFKHKNYGDCTKIKVESLPQFDLLVGGFPCQSFSIAGKRKGFGDTRGTLFFEIARIIKQKQPRLLLLENVKGLLSHDKGNTFTTIISTLDELGYDCQWQVLNSKNFGVPQNRERVFIIGHLRGTSRPEIFPIGGSNSENLRKIVDGGQGNRLYSTKGISTTIASNAGGQGAKTGLYKIDKKGNKKKNQQTAATLTGGGHSGGNHSDMDLLVKGARIRRLTPTECERLQGFPDGWTREGAKLPDDPKIRKMAPLGREITQISDTQRYKVLGNAVTVNVIEAIFNKHLTI